MENASKALIIAGAILLSILIIALGMGVYNQAKNGMGNADLSGTEVNAHNSKFEAYEGRMKGTEVSALITTIKSNNRDYSDRQIMLWYANEIKKDTGTVKTNIDTFKKDGTYEISGNLTEDINLSSKSYLKDDDGKAAYPTGIKNNTTYYVTFHKGDNGIINGCEIHLYSNAD